MAQAISTVCHVIIDNYIISLFNLDTEILFYGNAETYLPSRVFSRSQNPVTARQTFRKGEGARKQKIAEDRSQVPYNRFLYRPLTGISS
jgi:hypothetical protein